MSHHTKTIAEYTLDITPTTSVEVVEVRLHRAHGVERWGVGVGMKGRLLDYFEYARQRGAITAVYFPIPPSAPLLRSTPSTIHSTVMATLSNVALERYMAECDE